MVLRSDVITLTTIPTLRIHMWRFDLDYSKNLPQRTCISRPLPTLRTNSLKFRLVRILPQRTCISRPLPTLRTNSLKFRLVRINHKGRVFQDGTPVYHYKLVKGPMLLYPSPPPPHTQGTILIPIFIKN